MTDFIPIYQTQFRGNELAYLSDCIRTGWISSQGSYVERFERAFAEMCGVRHAIAVCNGTVSLHLALVVLGVGPGDEVLVPTLTFVATANAVRYTGATPVFVDCDPQTWNIDASVLEAKIGAHTKGIIAVHLYGLPADMARIQNVARTYGLWVIEDAAQSHGATYRGRPTGSLGDIGSFSLYGNKIITTGEGGMFTTDRDDLAEAARFLKDHAMSPDRRYWHPAIGYNYRMTNLQAAVGAAQLEQLEATLINKRRVASVYDDALRQIPGVILPPRCADSENVFWLYSIALTEDYPLSTNELMRSLKSAGIDSRPFFVPMHQLPPYQEAAAGHRFPVADRLSARGLSLPSFPTLTEEQIRRIADVIQGAAICIR